MILLSHEQKMHCLTFIKFIIAMIAKRKIKGIDKIFASLTRVLYYGYVSQKELYYCSLSSYNKKLMKVESPTQQKI